MSKSIDRRQFSKILGAGTAGLALPSLPAAAAEKMQTAARAQQYPPQPNIVFILTDDLGYNHLGCYGQEKIRTPNLDELASDGMRFTQSYAGCTVCAPSRSSLMTGTHTGHTSVRGNSGGIPLLPGDVTIGEVLQDAGYTTGIFGKWGLGDIRTTGVPSKQGFDEYMCTLDQVHAHFYYPEYLWHNDEKYPLPGNEGDGRETYSNDVFTEFTVDFIERQQDSDDPFFCFASYTIPHTELLVPQDSLEEYKGKFPEEPWESEGHYASQEYPHAAFAAMITRMDGYVGQIRDTLEEAGMLEDTLILFSSDNGGQRSGAGVDLEFFDGNHPLRGAKGDLYEGGIRVPSIAYWPGVIEPNTINHHPWAFWDLMPTFAELAGGEPAAGHDGLSFVPALLGEEGDVHDFFYWEYDLRVITGPQGKTKPNPDGVLHQALRMGDWKAIRAGFDGEIELFNLAYDLGEKFNVADQHPHVIRQAERLFRTVRTEARPQNEPSSPPGRLYR